MSNRKYIFFAWVFLPLLLPTVSLAGNAFRSATSVRATNPDLAAEARKVPLRGALRLTGLELDGIPGASDLELERFRVFTPDAQIVLDDSEILPVPDNRYFKGRIVGEPGSRVLLTLRQSGELRGLVFRSGEFWVLAGGPGSGIVAPGLVTRRAQPDRELGDRVEGFRCQTDRLPMRESASEPPLAQAQSVTIEQVAPLTYVAGVAIDTDTEYFAAFGNNIVDARDYAADLIAYSSTIYEAEVATSLQISYLQLWSSSDPWQESGCDVARLDELKAYWQAVHPTEERTLVHMLSGKSSQCGGAWIGTLCEEEWGYGFSSGLTLGFNINNPGIGWDIMVVSHEIGHNFDSPHTHCYGDIGGGGLPPVDECEGNEFSLKYQCHSGEEQLPLNCSGQSGCGTLMSYCHLYRNQITDISLTLGTDHPYGFMPDRVPNRMHDHVVSRAASNRGCLIPQLTIAKQGTGTGTVTSSPGGIDCGDVCTELYTPDAVVSLTATPVTDSTFAGWSGDVDWTGNDDCSDGSVTMSWSKTCRATFNLVERDLTIAKAGGGTVSSSPAGIDCGVDCLESYPHGSAVSLTAVPDLGWMVGEWSGDPDCSGDLIMSKDWACAMTFEPCPPELSQVDLFDLEVSDVKEFAACNTLTAAAFRILDGGDVTFRAGNSIILKDGFAVEAGATFRAIIGPPPS